MSWGIQTVYIPRENLRFLEEWLAYHTLIGADYFYLYDNTGSTTLLLNNAAAVNGRTKYGVELDFSLSDADILDIEAEILRKYPVTKVNWRPMADGKIIHGHVASVDHFAETTRMDWCAFIDIDEFVYSPYAVSDLLHGRALKMQQKKFADRFGYDRALEINRTFPIDTRVWGSKLFIRMEHYIPGGAHIHDLNAHKMGADLAVNFEHLHFHHYNHNRTGHQWLLANRNYVDPTWRPVPFEEVFTQTCDVLVERSGALDYGSFVPTPRTPRWPK